jgi:glyoxylase I family protein
MFVLYANPVARMNLNIPNPRSTIPPTSRGVNRTVRAIMNFSIEHIGLAATNPAALKAWYERALGATVVWENDATPRTYLLKLAEGAMLEIYPANAEDAAHRGDNKVAGFRHLAWRVDSLEQAKSELQKREVKIDDEVRPAAGGGKVLFFTDAEGNLLHLVERSAP